MTKSLWTAISYLQLLEERDQDRVAQAILVDPVFGSIVADPEIEVNVNGSRQTDLTTLELQEIAKNTAAT